MPRHAPGVQLVERPTPQHDWVLVSEPGFFVGFGSFPWKSNSFTRNEAQEQHSLLDTIFDFNFYFGPPVKYL